MTDQTGKSQALELAGIFHYVLAALIFVGGLPALIMMGIGTVSIMGVLTDGTEDMNIALIPLGLIFFVGPLLYLAVMLVMAILVLMAGRRIGNRTNLAFCQVIAGLECLCVPFGTVLGIWTLILLTQDGVKNEFH